MQIAQIPTKIQLPFANSAGGSYIRTVPVPSQIGITNGAASYTDGFPPLTFVPASAGGDPPDGRDMNYILNVLSAWSRWYAAGGPIYYDSTFAGNVGGYPAGTILQMTSGAGLWRNVVDNNSTNPDTGGANWQAFLAPGSLGGQTFINAGGSLTVNQMGTAVQIYGTASGQTITLPAIATVPSTSGHGYWFFNSSNQNWTIHANGTESIVGLGVSFTLQPNESIFVFNQQNVQWNVFGAIAALFPSGWLISILGNASTATAIGGGSAGQILYQSAANVTSKLPAGVAGQILTSGGTGAPAWVNAPGFAMTAWSYGNHPLFSGTGVLNYQTAHIAVGVTSYSAGTLTIANAGTYAIRATATCGNASANTGSVTIQLLHNGGTQGNANAWAVGTGQQEGVVIIDHVITVSAGDTVATYVACANGGQTQSGGYGSFVGHRIY